MAFVESWVETDPDGSVVTVSLLDNHQRTAKRAIRERCEGDPATSLSGWCELGTFGTTAMVKMGSGRLHTVPLAGIYALPVQDGRAVFTSDTHQLFHLKATGPVEIDYLNRDGSRSPSANISMIGFRLLGLGPGVANGESVRFEQALLIDQARTVTGLLTFNRGAASPFAVDAASLVVANLDADKLDGNDSTAFALAGHNHDINTLTGIATPARGGTGFDTYAIGDLLYATGVGTLAKRAIGVNGQWLRTVSGEPAWADGAIAEFIRKAADQVIANALATVFTKAILANEIWEFEAVIIFSHTVATGVGISVIAPAGASVAWGVVGQSGTSTDTSANIGAWDTGAGNAIIGIHTGNSNFGIAVIKGLVANGATPGDILIRVDSTADGGTFTVKDQSFAKYHKL